MKRCRYPRECDLTEEQHQYCWARAIIMQTRGWYRALTDDDWDRFAYSQLASSVTGTAPWCAPQDESGVYIIDTNQGSVALPEAIDKL